MKICMQCQAENPDTVDTCGSCGAELETPVVEQETSAVEQEAPVVEQEAPAAEQKKPKKNNAWVLIAVVVALSVLLVLAMFDAGKALYNRFHKEPEPEQNPSVSAPAEDPETPAEETPEEEPVEIVSNGHHTNAYGLPSHSIHFVPSEGGVITFSYMNEDGETVTLTEKEVDALMAQEVAACAGMTLTNGQLMYYYDDQAYSFRSTYSSYLSLLMNEELPMDEQLSMDGVNTWEQSFINGAVAMFQEMAAMYTEGKAEGYTMSDAEQAELDAMEEELNSAGQAYGFADGNAYLQAYFGHYASMESYLDYCEKNLYVKSYLTQKQSEMTVTDEELDAYYSENEAMLNSYGIFNVDKNVINVRHILIQPAASYDDDGNATYSDDAWAEAEEEVQRIYDEWLNGEATEESFAALAEEYTMDPGSMTTGGLYEEVFPNQMVAEFNDWCFADDRAVGDHGIVKTSYGYHIMFFSGEGDYIYWRQAAAEPLRMDKVDLYLKEVVKSYELTKDLDQAVLMNSMAPTTPAVEEETAAE